MSWVSSLLQSAGRLLPRRIHNALESLLLFGPFQAILRFIHSASTSSSEWDDKNNASENNLELTESNLYIGELDLDLDPTLDTEAATNLATASARRRARKQLRKRTAKQKKDQLSTMEPTNKGKGKALATDALPEITNRMPRFTLGEVPEIEVAKDRTLVWKGEDDAADAADAAADAAAQEQNVEEPLDPEEEARRAVHRGFMVEALDMARLALRTNETPVGCIFVHNGRIVAKGMNATNVTRNGSRHAELMALTALLTHSGDVAVPYTHGEHTDQEWRDVDPKEGFIYPYGQKLHPSPHLHPDFIKECVLYVTVEPCVMCASLLRQLQIKKVYFGAINDKFGGTGGVFRINKNSSPAPPPIPTYHLRERIKPKAAIKSQYDEQKLNSTIIIAEGTIPDANAEGDGGNVEEGFPIEGGWGRDQAVNLLRQFYVQENGRAPVPRKKEGRAARLAAMMMRDGQTAEGIIPQLGLSGELDDLNSNSASGASTPSLPAGMPASMPASPVLAPTVGEAPEKGRIPVQSGAAPTVEATMAPKPMLKPAVPNISNLHIANPVKKPAVITAKAGAPKT